MRTINNKRLLTNFYGIISLHINVYGCNKSLHRYTFDVLNVYSENKKVPTHFFAEVVYIHIFIRAIKL